LDSLDRPHIGYFDATNDDLRYARWTGAAWAIETVDSTGDVGWDASIALDSLDRPHIGYYDRTNGDLKYARWVGTTWVIETVDSTGDIGAETCLALDSFDRPNISYLDATNDDLKYARWTGTEWSIETVDSAASGNFLRQGRQTSIALDSRGTPQISYAVEQLLPLQEELRFATIDKMPPVVTVESPQTFGVYPHDSSEVFDYHATDNWDPKPLVSARLYDFDGNAFPDPSVGDPLPSISGVYRLIVTAMDDAGNSASKDVMFIVYDPSAGFATGGGWITPENIENKATFGFVTKYKEGEHAPEGNLEFQYNYRGINLKSTSLEWLTVSNNRAIFQGTATINGNGFFTFRVQAIDGDMTGGQPDHFAIKVWTGIDTETDPIHDYEGDLAGGNIKVHK
jgi:hypothetical protein